MKMAGVIVIVDQSVDGLRESDAFVVYDEIEERNSDRWAEGPL